MEMMDTVLMIVVYAAIFFGLPALAAAHKNRNPWFWGSCFFIVSLTAWYFYRYSDWALVAWFAVLMFFLFLPFICPKCSRRLSYREWKERQCPDCGSLNSE